MNTRDIKELQKRITTLHKNEHLEILKIIREDPIKYTENKNGITSTPTTTLKKSSFRNIFIVFFYVKTFLHSFLNILTHIVHYQLFYIYM